MKEYIGRLMVFLLLCATGLSIFVVMQKGGLVAGICLIGILTVFMFLERKDIVGPKLGGLIMIIFALLIVAAGAVLTYGVK